MDATVNKKKFRVKLWFHRSIEYWILAKIGKHEFNFEQIFFHLHALAFELMLKAAIILEDESVDNEPWVDSKCIFTERHDILKLIDRWNSLSKIKIVQQKSTGYRFWREKDNVCLSHDSWIELEKYLDLHMVGRYPEAQLVMNFSSLEVIDFIYFVLRDHIRNKLGINEDDFDSASAGSLGRSTNQEWITRAVRKSNFGIKNRIID